MHGYEIFCVEYFQSKYVKNYIEKLREITNDTCPDISILNATIWNMAAQDV